MPKANVVVKDIRSIDTVTTITVEIMGAPRFKSEVNKSDFGPSWKWITPKYVELKIGEWGGIGHVVLKESPYDSKRLSPLQQRVLGTGDSYWNGVRRNHWLQKIVENEVRRHNLFKELNVMTKAQLISVIKDYNDDVKWIAKVNHVQNLTSIDRTKLQQYAKEGVRAAVEIKEKNAK